MRVILKQYTVLIGYIFVLYLVTPYLFTIKLLIQSGQLDRLKSSDLSYFMFLLLNMFLSVNKKRTNVYYAVLNDSLSIGAESYLRG